MILRVSFRLGHVYIDRPSSTAIVLLKTARAQERVIHTKNYLIKMTERWKAVRGLWDGSSKILCRSGCGVVIKGVDRNRWITISKIAVPLGIGSAMAAEFTSRSEMFHEVARNNCSFVADEARFDVEHIRHVFHSLCFSVAFPEHVFLGFLPAHSHAGFGIVALDHQQDKVWKTEYRHGVLLWTGEK